MKIRLFLFAVLLLVLSGRTLAEDGVLGTIAAADGVRASGTPAMTNQFGWNLVRSVDANDTALTEPNLVWTQAKSLFVQLDPAWNTITLAFLAYDGNGDPNDGSFAFKVWTIRKFSSGELVCNGTATVGELPASHMPYSGVALTSLVEDYKWAEGQFVLAPSPWPLDISASGTTNDLGKLSFNPLGALGLYVEITALTNIDRLYVLVTGR